AQPVMIPTPPQGNRSERLGRLLTLGRKQTSEAIGELVAALGDEDEQLRWLASLSLLGMGGSTVIATLQAFMAQAPSAVAREEAEKVLGKLEAFGG
ncbi:MAG: HEAT repeat domain-containing protein, partial [Anaerolineae bacterium]